MSAFSSAFTRAFEKAWTPVWGAIAELVALYNPATQFAPALPGLWYDPSDYATLTQDSAGATPVTAAGQTVGQMLDKSGRGNTISQATAAARPLTATAGAILSHTYDGVDDGMATGTFTAGTLGADMDCFIAIRRSSSKSFALLYNNPSATAVAVGDSLDSAASNPASTGGTLAVNGVVVTGGTAATRQQLAAAVPVSSWAVVEVRNVNLSAFTSIGFGGFNFGYQILGDIGGIILAPAGDATTRANNRKFLGAKVGLTL